MLTDEELTTRLAAAFRETVPELTYTGRVPRVRRTGTLATTSVLAASTALALAPHALQHNAELTPRATPSARPGDHATRPTGHTVTRTLEVAGLRLTYASVDGRPGPLYFVLGPTTGVPADAEQLHLGLAVDVWFVPDAGPGDPQVLLQPHDSATLYGLLAPGWTRQQLVDMLEHGSRR
ncbi:hypothetical protein [Nocardioides cynanchi]|uniref:hypothetical protein n=1 Tax=Nocardioides cynanchi TaxID=2558918 RepID=UPI0012470CBB|nr:hypothetical protein [Nocardioides cynanchi]